MRSEFAFNSNNVSNIYNLTTVMVLLLYIAVSGTPSNRSGLSVYSREVTVSLTAILYKIL